jgi:hypothetical protein
VVVLVDVLEVLILVVEREVVDVVELLVDVVVVVNGHCVHAVQNHCWQATCHPP